jgi:molybdopterin-guanine dinucleotide biosynthesis protein A
MYDRRMDGTASDVATFILAGGKSTRMGTDKAFVTLDGRTLLARVLEVVRSVTDDVRIVGDAVKYAPFAPVVEDVFRNCGPLGGIHAALRSSQADLNLILAVDVPFASRTFLQYLIGRARSLPSAMVTVARTSEGWQPLCAVYRREFAELAENFLRAGRYKIDALFDEGRTQVIGEDELQSAGFSLRIFRNLNTPEELAEAGE